MRVLHALNLLDTVADEELEALTRAASLVCETPIALLSLVDAERQWLLANLGLPGVRETSRSVAFCAHAINGNDIFEVPDAVEDSRFAANPLVLGDPNIRFYAGAPLEVEGQRIGTLCVIDRKPGRLTAKQMEILLCLSTAATSAIERRAKAASRWNIAETTASAIRGAWFARTVVDAMPALAAYWDDGLVCRFANVPYLQWFGKRRDEVIGMHLPKLLGEELFEQNRPFVEGALAGREQRFKRLTHARDGSVRHVLAHYLPDLAPSGLVLGFFSLVVDVTAIRN